MAIPLAALAVGIGEQAAAQFIERLVGPFVEGLGNNMRWDIGKKLGVKHWFSEAYDSFVDAEAHPISGYSAAGMMDVVYRLFETTIRLSLIVDGEMVEEMFLEMLQEGLSNAMQYAYGAAWQTHFNVYRGCAPPYADDVDEIMRVGKQMDHKLRSFLVASSGASIPNFGRQSISAFQRWLSDEFSHLRPWLADKLRDREDVFYRPLAQLHTIAMSYAEAQAEKAWMVWRRAYDMISDAARRYLARVNELWDELESVKAWYDAELISDEDASLIAREIAEETSVIAAYFDDFKSEVESAATQIEQNLTYDFSPVDDVKSKYNDLASSLITFYGDLTKSLTNDFITLIEETLKRLRAYRYYSEVTTPPDAPVLEFEISIYRSASRGLGRIVLGRSALGAPK